MLQLNGEAMCPCLPRPAGFEARLPSLYLDIALDGLVLYDTGEYIAERLGSLEAAGPEARPAP